MRNENSERGGTPLGEITVEELIRSQLEGKSTALHRYDQIVWKVRAGYLAVLYALLTILSGKEFELTDLIGPLAKIDILLYTAIGFSTCAFLIDAAFMVAKLRVVDSRNRLSDLALKLAIDKPPVDKLAPELRELLHLSGEKPDWPGFGRFVRFAWPVLLLYPATPTLIAVFRALLMP